jgi:starvation-inducible DNA-binding protein
MATDDNAEKTYLALPDEAVQQNIKNLQVLLANTMYLYSLNKKYHWHVTGEDFYQYHLLFDKHADEQLPIVDLLAERLRTLGSRASGMPDEVVANTTLKEADDAGHYPQAMVRNLLKVYERHLASIREAVKVTEDTNDVGTNDLLASDVLRVNELQLWFIRSSLK